MCDTMVDRDVKDIQNCVEVMSIGIRIGAVFQNSSNEIDLKFKETM